MFTSINSLFAKFKDRILICGLKYPDIYIVLYLTSFGIDHIQNCLQKNVFIAIFVPY